MLEKIKNPAGEVEIAIVGKYVELDDAYKSINESLTHAAIHAGYKLKRRLVAADHVKPSNVAELLDGAHGVLVPGGFGERGIEGKIESVRHARETGLPFFGICLGMQCAAIEFARHVLGWKSAHSTEFDPKSEYPVIHLMPEQQGVKVMGGTMRLGAYPLRLVEGSVVQKAYGATEVRERHRHRYEFNSQYLDAFSAAGMKASGVYPDRQLVDTMELDGHPWFVGVQYHPEFQSKPGAPHPLFRDFVAQAIAHSKRGAAASP